MILDIQAFKEERRVGPGLLKQHRISARFAAELQRLRDNPQGCVPSQDFEGGRHEVDQQTHELKAAGALNDPSRRPVRRSGRIVLTGSKGDVLQQLRAMIRVEERRS